MTAFSYQAVDRAGKRTYGVIEAGNAAAARRALRDRALLPLSVTTSQVKIKQGLGMVAGVQARVLRRGVSRRALATVTRQLSTLIGGGVRIEEALQLVARQNEAHALAEVLLDVRATVLEGASLALGLGRHSQAFPDYFRAAVAAGEQSGRIAEVLVYLADFVETSHRARQKLQLALLYPALLAGVSVVMMTMMMIYVVPDIVRVFVTHGTNLPFLTRALIALSRFVSNYGLASLVVMIGAIVAARRELAKPGRRLALDRTFATRRPFSRFTLQANAARFAWTLATLVQSAVPLLDALNAAAAVLPNRYLRTQAEDVARRVREGESVHRALAATQVFPAMLVAIVASGETGGKLGPALARAAAELDRETEAQVAVMVSLVEPAVLLLMGGLVLMMVLAILMPIMGLNDLAAM